MRREPTNVRFSELLKCGVMRRVPLAIVAGHHSGGSAGRHSASDHRRGCRHMYQQQGDPRTFGRQALQR